MLFYHSINIIKNLEPYSDGLLILYSYVILSLYALLQMPCTIYPVIIDAFEEFWHPVMI